MVFLAPGGNECNEAEESEQYRMRESLHCVTVVNFTGRVVLVL